MDFLDFVKRLGLSGAGAWLLHHFIGEAPYELVQLYASFILLDIVTGTLAAALRHRVRASVAWVGALKKLMGLCAVAMGHLVDQAAGTGVLARNTMAVVMCTYEFSSILENLAVAGIVVPDQVRDLFAKVMDAKFTPMPGTDIRQGAAGAGATKPPERETDKV